MVKCISKTTTNFNFVFQTLACITNTTQHEESDIACRDARRNKIPGPGPCRAGPQTPPKHHRFSCFWNTCHRFNRNGELRVRRLADTRIHKVIKPRHILRKQWNLRFCLSEYEACFHLFNWLVNFASLSVVAKISMILITFVLRCTLVTFVIDALRSLVLARSVIVRCRLAFKSVS